MDLLLTPEAKLVNTFSLDPSTSHPQPDITPDITKATDPTTKP